METINRPKPTIHLDEFENRECRKTLSVTDIYRNKFEGKNTIDDLSSPF